MRNPLLSRLPRPFSPCPSRLGSGPGPEEEGPVTPLSPEAEHPETALEQLARHHYVRRAIDDSLSSDTLDHYLDALDPQRAYFLEGDIAQFERYRYTLDDALRRGDLAPAFEIFNRYQATAETQLESILRLLESGIEALDFSDDEYLAMDRSEEPFLTNADTREDLWRRRLKASVLSLKLAEKADDVIGPLLEKRYRNRLHRLRQTSAEDAFQLFMNALAASYDPTRRFLSAHLGEFQHPNELVPRRHRAVLRVEDEYTTIASLAPAGPAEKSRISPPIGSAPLPRGTRVNSWSWWAGALSKLWTSFGAPQAPRCASKCSPRTAKREPRPGS